MFRDYKILRKIAVLSSVLLLCASQTTYASQMDNTGSEDKKEYKTVEVKRGDFARKSTIKNVELKYLRYDALGIDESKGYFKGIMVEHEQIVKKGDPLIAYDVPSDSITIEESKKNLEYSETSYEKQCEKLLDQIEENVALLQSMTYDDLEAQIMELNIEKQKLEYEQYKYRTEKSLKDMREKIAELEEATETRYITAPYDGIVYLNWRELMNLKEGVEINRGRTLLYINDMNSAVLASESSTINKLWYNMDITLKSGNSEYPGKVIAVDSLFNTKVSSGFICYRENEKAASPIKKADITADIVSVKNVIVIPLNVVKTVDDMKYVNLLDDNGEVRKQFISGRDNGVDMWVYNGLTEGQKILAE